MKSPFTGKEMTLEKEWREMTYRKEQFNVLFHFYRCEDTKEQFEDDKYAQLNFNQVVNQYRVRHRIPFPEQIKVIREKYHLSAARMANIMGMGANSWRNYESGEVPSKVHANLIQMINKPDTFEQHIKQYCELKEKDRIKILKQIDRIKNIECCCTDQYYMFQSQPDIYSGFKQLNKKKLNQIVLFFAEHLEPYKTKMNKLLFYVDFVHFREVGCGITGLKYKAISFGPVPNNYDILFGIMADIGVIDVEYSMTQHGEVERIIPTSDYQFDKSLFSAKELQVLDYIATTFKDTSASEIAEISHQESAWKESIDGRKIIPFYYAFRLETV